MSKDKDILDAVKLEDNIEYRFDLVREDALERGINQGILQGITQGVEQNKLDIIKQMLKKNIDIPTISSITGKSIEEIEKMASKEELKTNGIKLEDNIEYRFDLVREDALERSISQGITQGAEEKTKDIIKEMLKNNATLEFISNVTGKSIDEIKEIENSIKE